MSAVRCYITAFLIAMTLLVTHALPKPQYEGLNILEDLAIPHTLANWRSRDYQVSIDNTKDDRYNFISDVFARLYWTRFKDNLIFMILDAGNFHHPKVCFTSSGYTIQEIPDQEINLKNKKISVKRLAGNKNQEKFLIVYWLCVNRKITDWTGQKWLQLWHSLFGKKKVSLMMRIDIPVPDGDMDRANRVAQQFIKDMYDELPADERTYVFGQ